MRTGEFRNAVATGDAATARRTRETHKLPFCDDPIEKLEHRVEHYGRIQVHIVSFGYTFMVCAIAGSGLATLGSGTIFCSYSSKDGISTLAFFAYARATALLP